MLPPLGNILHPYSRRKFDPRLQLGYERPIDLYFVETISETMNHWANVHNPP